VKPSVRRALRKRRAGQAERLASPYNYLRYCTRACMRDDAKTASAVTC